MRNCAILTLPALLVLCAACSKTPYQELKATDPLLVPSKQVQQQFFACKDLIGKEWVGVGQDFSTDDEKIIIISRLDPSQLKSWLTFEILSPDDQIIEKEDLTYEAVRDVGIEFSPVKLADKGGPGRYKANVYSDSRPMGQVVFYLEDRREEGPLVGEGESPELSSIQWETPSE
jgi:hypothetical protein